MNLRFIGGILLIVGTSIGGGMLALPIANAAIGLWESSLFLLLCWAMMTIGAFFILEVNLYLPRGKHMLSMAVSTMGTPGLVIAWLSYIFLLYTLLSAYISGGADLLGSLTSPIGIPLSEWQSSILFTFIFGLAVYGGIRRVDLLNRLLMFGKLLVFVVLIMVIAPHIRPQNIQAGNLTAVSSVIMLLITSFGFAIIVPNLRDYFEDDIPTLRKVLWIGSLIPLVCYIAWDAVIIGSLPAQGAHGLNALMHSDHATSELAGILSSTIQNGTISTLFNFFTSICMLTAFLGVALCLISFLADGLRMEQKGREGFVLFILTFLPPLLLVIYYPGAYIQALNYAGIFCVILLLMLPALMTIFGRKKFTGPYQVAGGLFTPYSVLVFSCILLLNAAYQISRAFFN